MAYRDRPLFGTGYEGFGTTWSGGGGNPDEYEELHRALTEAPGAQQGTTRNYRGLGPKQYRRSDERIFEDVCIRLTDHPEIDAGDMEVAVKDGEVTLTGTADSRRTRRMAEDVAESVRGVRDVRNELRVRTPAEIQR